MLNLLLPRLHVWHFSNATVFIVGVRFCPPGGRPPPDLRVDHGGSAGVQPQRKPQRSDVVCVPALPRTGQSGPQLELLAPKLYPLLCSSDRVAHLMILSSDLEKQVCPFVLSCVVFVVVVGDFFFVCCCCWASRVSLLWKLHIKMWSWEGRKTIYGWAINIFLSQIFCLFVLYHFLLLLLFFYF